MKTSSRHARGWHEEEEQEPEEGDHRQLLPAIDSGSSCSVDHQANSNAGQDKPQRRGAQQAEEVGRTEVRGGFRVHLHAGPLSVRHGRDRVVVLTGSSDIGDAETQERDHGARHASPRPCLRQDNVHPARRRHGANQRDQRQGAKGLDRISRAWLPPVAATSERRLQALDHRCVVDDQICSRHCREQGKDHLGARAAFSHDADRGQNRFTLVLVDLLQVH
mmetsp:Transcript_86645/g.258569  ORF Transcript_86645/g.258569 Transcript_86645/m.258569 type:complete len:220 (-) Transcript_86645:190-849(-)